MNEQSFRNPGPGYGGVTLWMLNDALERDEIGRQLQGIRAAGWDAVITRTFNGLRTEYLSKEWMQILEHIVAQAQQVGLKVWFQAGYMPSAVPDLSPALTHRVLTRAPLGAASIAGETVLSQDDKYRYLIKPQEHVLDLLNPAAVDAYLEQAYTQTWLERFGEHFGSTIEAIWVDEPHFRPPLLPWTETLPQRFQAAWGSDLIDQLSSLLSPVGEWRQVRHHYWRVVTEMLLEAYFDRVRDWCQQHHVWFCGHLMGEDTLNNQVGWTGAAMPCYRYMHLPGVDHLTKSLTWPTGKPFVLTPKQCSSAANQMGKDLVLSEMYAVSSQGITFEDRKEIGEWLAVLGTNYRCYHGTFYSLRGRRKRIYPPALSYQQPWWTENAPIARYFARLCYALRQGEYNPEILVVHPGESAFCLYDTVQMTEPHDRTREPPDVQALDTALVTLCTHLLSIQRSFELGDEGLLAQFGRVTSDGLSVDHMTYKAVILPDMLTIRASTWALLDRFAAAGGTILAAGRLPERIDGSLDDRSRALVDLVQRVPNERDPLHRALAGALPSEVTLEPSSPAKARSGTDTSNIWLHARRAPGLKLYYLHNTSRTEGAAAQLCIRGQGKLERWELETGEICALPQRTERERICTPLAFAPLSSHLIVLREDATPGAVEAQDTQIVRQEPVFERPQFSRQDPNALTLDYARYRQGRGEWSAPLPVLTIYELLAQQEYRGPLSLSFAFEVADRPSQAAVVIEDAAQYRIRINGASIEYTGSGYWIDRSFHPIDVTSLVQQGSNEIQLDLDFRPLPQAQFSLARLFQRREGTELEAIYVIGDFAVASARSEAEAKPRCVRLAPDFRILSEQSKASSDLVSGGYPFYAGRITLSDQVILPAPQKAERIVLTLPGIDAAALVKVRVNDTPAGAIMWAPYECDITDLVQEGENQIALKLVSTLRNLLGPHHRPEGEPDQCWTDDYVLRPEWLADEKTRQAHWTDDYFFVRFGIAPGAMVRYISHTP